MTDVMKEQDSMETTQPASLEEMMVKRMMTLSWGRRACCYVNVVCPFKAIGGICVEL